MERGQISYLPMFDELDHVAVVEHLRPTSFDCFVPLGADTLGYGELQRFPHAGGPAAPRSTRALLRARSPGRVGRIFGGPALRLGGVYGLLLTW